MTKNLNIGIDIDGVLADFNSAFWAWHNEKFQTNIDPLKDCTTYDYTKVLQSKGFQVGVDDIIERINKFLSYEKFVEQIPVVSGAFDGISELASIADLYVITSRHPSLKDITTLWLDTHFPSLFKNILLTGNMFKAKNYEVTKSDIVKEYDIQWVVEDAVFHAEEIVKNGALVVLLEQPWNKDVDFNHKNLYRVKDWKEVVDCIKKVELKDL